MKRTFLILWCGWIFWHMWTFEREQRFEPMSSQMTIAECVARAKTFAPYEKKAYVIHWYADLKNQNNWFGCFPDDYDPRDEGK